MRMGTGPDTGLNWIFEEFNSESKVKREGAMGGTELLA